MENQVSTDHNRVPLSWLPTADSITESVETSTESVQVNSENGRENVSLEPKAKKLGRPVSVVEAYRYILARDGALKYAEKVAEDALEAKNARDRLAAIQEMTDRVEGKAVQNIRHAGVFMVMAPGEEVLNAAFGAIAPSEDE